MLLNKIVYTVCLLALVSACGGGGGGSSPETSEATAAGTGGSSPPVAPPVAPPGGGSGGGDPLPIAADDMATTVENEAVDIPVLDNDSEGLTLVSVTVAANGTVEILAGSGLRYTPGAGYTGADSFDYSARDSAGQTTSATVSVEVTPMPEPPMVPDNPIARDDRVLVAVDADTVIRPLLNDTDANGDTLSVESYSVPSHGVLTSNSDGTFLYTPDAGYLGEDQFIYVVTDGELTDSAMVNISVLASLPDFAGLTLREALDLVPEGNWARVNLNRFEDVWVPSGQRADGGNAKPDAVIGAWGAMAWDSNRNALIFFGGGHGDYPGNEIYLWRADTLSWERGSLPSEVENISSGWYETVDGYQNSPISSHTYDNSEYLPALDRFISFGGASYNLGGPFLRSDGETMTGPYLWDPSKANPDAVAGLAGSQANPSSYPDVEATQAWQNRDNLADAGLSNNLVSGTSEAVTEGGIDVIYFGRRDLWKLSISNLGTPATDVYEKVGDYFDAFGGQGAGTVDLSRNWYVRTANNKLVAWNLNTPGTSNRNIGFVPDTLPPGFDVGNMREIGIDYDEERDRLLLWGGDDKVWQLQPPVVFGTGGWTLSELPDGTVPEYPDTSSSSHGVLGKWKYAPDLDVFFGVNDKLNGDVWVYKPQGWNPKE